MELIKAGPETYDRIKSLYLTAFPANERIPFRLLVRRSKQGRADFWNLMDHGEWIGLAYTVRHKDLIYLIFFAVDGIFRGKGYGTRAVETIRNHYKGCRLILALEPLDPQTDNYSQRLRRHAFYERCGLSDMPFMIREAGVTYAVMATDSVLPQEYQELADNWLGYPLRWFAIMKTVLPKRNSVALSPQDETEIR